MHYIKKSAAEKRAFYETHKDTPTQTELGQGAYKVEHRDLTQEQKDLIMYQEEERKKLYAEEVAFRQQWMEKYYGDKTDRDLANW